jgi:hypothetical protein
MLVSYTLRTSMMTCSERHDARPRGYLRGRTMYLSGRMMCLSGWASTRRAGNIYKNLHSRCCLFPWPCENPAAQDAPPPAPASHAQPPTHPRNTCHMTWCTEHTPHTYTLLTTRGLKRIASPATAAPAPPRGCRT